MPTPRPLFSIITPVYDPPLAVLEETISSVGSQSYKDWELLLVDDHSDSSGVRAVLHAAANRDSRIRVIERATNGGISSATNDGIQVAEGEFIALLDHDDLLHVDALQHMADAIETHPEADYLYSDEDKVDEEGNHFGAFLKPDWSPERLRGQMYTCHLSVLRTSLVEAVGGFDSRYDGSQDHDLVLKVTERAREIVHVPEVLYSWRAMAGSTAQNLEDKPYAWLAGREAVQAHLDRVGIRASAELGRYPGTYSLVRELPATERVSVVIPTCGSGGVVWGEPRYFVVEAVRSLLAMTEHPDLEIVIVYDAGTPEQILAELQEIVPRDQLVLLPYAEPFNFSRKCNLGVLQSTGRHIVLLNDDVQVKSANWLEQLVAPLLESDVGMTGARLLYSDGTLQHGGHNYAHGHIAHTYYYSDGSQPGPFYSLVINREASGVTAACAAIRRDVFEEVGGLCELLPGNFNDVDFSLKIGKEGYRILWLANVELYHFEAKTRQPAVAQWEYDLIDRRWRVRHRDRDPFVVAP